MLDDVIPEATINDRKVRTKLERISQLSTENPEMVFTSIGHLINKELLQECHEKMDGDKAVGIDGVTKEEYGKNWEIGPQKRLYIPALLLKLGKNEIVVFETEGKSIGVIELKDEPDIG